MSNQLSAISYQRGGICLNPMSLPIAHGWPPGSRAEAHGLKPVTHGLRGRDKEPCALSFSSGRFPLSEGLESVPDERERQLIADSCIFMSHQL